MPEALDLLTQTFDPAHPEREARMNEFHVLAGWALFADLQSAP